MTDIVERLLDPEWKPLSEHDRREAAAELEQLREHVNALRLVATSHEPEALRQQAEIEQLRKVREAEGNEIERLRTEVAILRTTEASELERLRLRVKFLEDELKCPSQARRALEPP